MNIIVGGLLILLVPSSKAVKVTGAASGCEQDVLPYVGWSGDALFPVCRERFSYQSCEAAGTVLDGRSFTVESVRSVCTTLMKTEVDLQHRMSLLVHRASVSSKSDDDDDDDDFVETALVPKRGDVNYFIKAVDRTDSVTQTIPTDGNDVPLDVVNLSYVEPPDSDGNPYNEPEWYDGR